MRALIFVLGVLAADTGPRELEVELGKTVEVEVGYAIGFRCDDLTIVDPAMKNVSETTNLFVVKGLRAGTTLCRVGTDPQRPTMLFEVRVR